MRERQEEGDGASNEGTWRPLGVRDPEVFFCGLRRADEVCGWMCGWILPAISEKRPITSHSVLFELNSKNTLSVLNLVRSNTKFLIGFG